MGVQLTPVIVARPVSDREVTLLQRSQETTLSVGGYPGDLVDTHPDHIWPEYAVVPPVLADIPVTDQVGDPGLPVEVSERELVSLEQQLAQLDPSTGLASVGMAGQQHATAGYRRPDQEILERVLPVDAL